MSISHASDYFHQIMTLAGQASVAAVGGVDETLQAWRHGDFQFKLDVNMISNDFLHDVCLLPAF